MYLAMYSPDNYGPTQRELEVINLLYKGYSNKEIANQLCITLRTVEHHLETAYQKLNANGRADAVVKALKVGWITLEDDSNEGT
jgi:DNA-binding NarL/FixJ family response regulator